MDLTEFFLLRVSWAFWIRRLMFFIKFGKFSVIIPSNTLPDPFLRLCLHYAYVTTFGIVAQIFDDQSPYLFIWFTYLAASRGLSPCGTQLSTCVSQTPGCSGLAASQHVGSQFPWPGAEPVSPPSPGSFLAAGPPGKSLFFFLKHSFFSPSNWVISVELFWNLLILLPPQIFC